MATDLAGTVCALWQSECLCEDEPADNRQHLWWNTQNCSSHFHDLEFMLHILAETAEKCREEFQDVVFTQLSQVSLTS